MNLREIIEGYIKELKEATHSGSATALRAAISMELTNAWTEGYLFTDEDAVDMMKEAHKEGYQAGYHARCNDE